jgi:hypothetical protein
VVAAAGLQPAAGHAVPAAHQWVARATPAGLGQLEGARPEQPGRARPQLRCPLATATGRGRACPAAWPAAAARSTGTPRRICIAQRSCPAAALLDKRSP